MLSEIERNIPNIYGNKNLDINELISLRKNRNKLFGQQYFTDNFWDIILLLYLHKRDDRIINAHGLSNSLDIASDAILRYLNVLYADNIICAYDEIANDRVDLANDNLSLTALGFENTGIIIQQTSNIFTSYAKSAA